MALSRVSDNFPSTWQSFANTFRRAGTQFKRWWYLETGVTQAALEELCRIHNMAEFRAVLAAASGYYLPAKHLFNPDGTPKHKTEICAEATELMNRLQSEVSTKTARAQQDLLKMGYWTSSNEGRSGIGALILGIWYWFFVNTGEKNKSKAINRMIHETYYEWEDLMQQDVDYETEEMERALGKIVCKHCAAEDLEADKLRAIIMKEHPNVDALAFMDPYGQLLGPAGICKSMALMIAKLRKRRVELSDVKTDKF